MNLHRHNRQAGFTLIELMVGVTIALIGLLIIAGVLASSNQQKQTTSSGADAQTSGAIATFIIERDARMAGYGVNQTSLLGCQINAYDGSVSPAREFVFNLVPIAITAGTATTPDSISITYGTADIGFAAPRLTQTHNGNNANYKVDNRFGFQPGNLVVVSEPGVDADGDGIDDCTLAEVTNVPGTPGQTDVIIHNSGNYQKDGQNVSARYNKPSGLGIAYSTNARVYNLGDIPVTRIYAVDTANSQLTSLNTLTQASADAIAENVVFLRAQYGKDADGDGTVDTYDQVMPVGAAQWQQVIALRYAVVARAQKRDTQMVSAATLELWPEITLPSGTVLGAQTLALTDEQRRYRYKVFTTLVPLRNQIWRLNE